MSNHVDDIDRQIISLLQKDGRMPYLTIANELGLAEGTIRRRVARLIDEQILQIVGVTDPLKVGMQTVAIVGMKVERSKIDQIVQALSDMSEVRYVALSTGNYDLVIEVVVPSNDHLLKFLINKLDDIPGIYNANITNCKLLSRILAGHQKLKR